MPSKFHYQARSNEDWEKRASQQGGGFQGYILDDFRLYTLKKGENAIRILPPTWDGAKHYGMDVYTHFGIGPDKATVLCPLKMAEQKCPICEARALAEKRGDEDMVKDLRPSKRVLVWLIDRKDEDKGPVVWGMPWTVDRDISKVSRDRGTGKYYFVDHPEEGFDIYFDREGEGIGTKYTGVQLARRATSVDEEWLEYIQAHPLPETLLIRDYEEILELFEGAAGGPAEPEASPRPIERARQAAAKANGSERQRSERPDPEPAPRSSRPQLEPNRKGVRRNARFGPVAVDDAEGETTDAEYTEEGPPFDTEATAGDPPPPDEPPEEQEEEAPRRPTPKTPAREPAPAAAQASKAASLRERFARGSRG